MSKPSLFSSPWSTNLQALGTKRRISTQVGIDAFQVPRRFLPARDLRRHQVPVPSDRLHHAALSPPIESPAKHDIPGRNEPVVLLLLVIIIIVLVVSKYVEIVDFLHEILLGLFLLSLRGVEGGGVSILVVTNGMDRANSYLPFAGLRVHANTAVVNGVLKADGPDKEIVRVLRNQVEGLQLLLIRERVEH